MTAPTATLPPPTTAPESVPAHYAGAVEPLAAIEDWSRSWPVAVVFHLGCVVKYLARCGRKGDLRGDLRKARDYLDRALAVLGDGPS